jgi:BASS family bile acid:Na+ symporter
VELTAMTLKTLLPIALNMSLFLVVFATGLRANLWDATHLLRSPGEFVRALLAMSVLMPLFVAALVLIIDLDSSVRIALVALSIAPVPTLLPMQTVKTAASVGYAIGVLVMGSVLAIIFVPIAMEVIEQVYSVPLHMTAVSIATFVFMVVLLPIGLGLAVHRYAPALAQRLAEPIARIAGIGVLVFLGVLMVLAAPAMWTLIGNGTVLAIVAFVLVGLVIGHLLGGPTPANRTALAFSTASRHPGLAILIVQTNFPAEKLALAAALLFLLVNIIVTSLYPFWIKWRQPGVRATGRSA